MQLLDVRNKRGQLDGKKASVYVKKRLAEGAMCKTIAAELGVTQKSLASTMTWWRSKGIEIPNMHYEAPEGHIKTKGCKGVKYLQIKVNGKWKQIGRAEGQPYKDRSEYRAPGGRKRMPNEPVTPRVVKGKIKTMPRCKESKKEVEKLPTKVVDASKMKMVKVSKTTHIQVSVDIPDEIAIQNWNNKYNLQNQVSK